MLRLNVFGSETDHASLFRWPEACSVISLLCCCTASLGSSWVQNAAQVCPLKSHSWLPSCHKDCWRSTRDSSVCIWSLANACHLQSWNSRVWMLESWAGGKRPSNMGMAYWSATHHAPSANQHSDEQSLYLKDLLKKPGWLQPCVSSNVRWKTADSVETEWRNLYEPKIMHVRNCLVEGSCSLPFVEYLNLVEIDSMHYLKSVLQNTLQDSELELMQQICN